MTSRSGQTNRRRNRRRLLRGLEVRAAFEQLEDRYVLSAPTIDSVSPPASSHLAFRDAPISAVFDQQIEPGTVSAPTMAVHGRQTGTSPDGESTFLADGQTVSITPGKSFAPGELVQVTLTDGIQNPAGEVARPFVWQFRALAGDQGSGFFEDSGQALGRSSTSDVALGDLDGDGDLDAFVGNLGTRHVSEANRVWLNDGQGRLSDSGQDFGEIRTAAVALGDLDGDGDLDAFVGNRGFNSLHDSEDEVWLNDGRGSFSHSGQSFGQSHTTAVALGDLDGDGDLDAIAGDLRYIWRNDGRGQFSKTRPELTPRWTGIQEIALGDVDGDGDLDAFTAEGVSFPGGPNHVWLNDGDGGFTNIGQDLGRSASSSVDLGDLDGDGDLDAFVANRAYYTEDHSNRVWLNDGHGVFRDSGQQLGDAHSLDVQLGDVDGDGDLDAFVGNAIAIPDSLFTAKRPARNRVWLNDGTGHFTHNNQKLGSTFSEAVALGDMDGDGDLDAFIGTDGVPGEQVGANKIWLNADKPVADLSIRLTNDRAIALAGQPVTYSLTVTNELPQDVHGARVSSDISSRIGDLTWTCSASPGSQCSASGVGNIEESVSILALGQLTYTLTGLIDTSANVTITSAGTVTIPADVRDLRPASNSATDVDRILPREVVPAPNSTISPLNTDITVRHNRDIDTNSASVGALVIRGSQSGQLIGKDSALRVDGDTVIASTSSSIHPGELVQVTATDRIENLDGQGPISPFVWNFRAATGVGRGAGTGLFRIGDQPLGAPTAETALTDDVDGDGDVDVFIGDLLWLNDGTGQMAQGEQIIASAAVMGDLDGDGDNDVVTHKGHVLLNNGRGGFQRIVQRVGNGDQPPAIQGLRGALRMETPALGDLDDDGDLDIYLGRAEIRFSAHSDDYFFTGLPNHVWLNDGDGNFTDSGQQLGESHTHDVALGDLDADGDLDAYVANGLFHGRNIVDRVWLNDGRGFFIDSGQRLSEFVTAEVSLGDLDGDGDLDAFLGKYEYVETPSEPYPAGRPGRTPNEVWLNDGQGRFSDSGQQLGNSLTQGVALGDADGDGDLDALVVNTSPGAFQGVFLMDEASVPVPDRLWLNDGQGHFAPTEQTLTHADSSDVAWGDLDRDGDLDVVIAHSDTDANSIWLNVDEAGTDLSISLDEAQTTTSPGEVITFDITVTNHGPQDVAGAVVNGSFPSQMTDITWTCTATDGSSCTPRGIGDILDAATLVVGGTAMYIVSATVDAAANVAFTSAVRVIPPEPVTEIKPADNEATSIRSIPPRSVQPSPNSLGAQLDSDIAISHHRMLAPSSVSGKTIVIHGSQSGQLLRSSDFVVQGDTVSVGHRETFHPGELVQVTATGGIENLDGQGPISPYVWQFRTAVGQGNGAGTGAFVETGQIDTSFTNDVVLGDVDGDGDLDVLLADRRLLLWLNDGQGNFHDSHQDFGPGYANQAALVDLDGDGDLDAVRAKASPEDKQNHWINDGSGSFRAHTQELGGPTIQRMAFGDLDNDGDIDAILASQRGPATVWLNNGKGDFTNSGRQLGDQPAVEIQVGDLDGDGDLDAVLERNSSEADNVWLNDGSGEFQGTGQDLQRISHYRRLHLGDLDADGDLDVAASDGARSAILLNDGLGNLTHAPFGPTSNAVALGDIDGDGNLDALAPSSKTGGVWLSRPSQKPDGPPFAFLRRAGEGGIAMDARTVAVGDLDNDGDLDAIVGNSRAPASVWLNQGFNEALWTGDGAVGSLGDGRTWDDPDNWTFNGELDRMPENDVPPVDVTLAAGQTIGSIELGMSRTVKSIRFHAGYMLEGETLTVESGEVTVNRNVVASVGSDLRSGTGVVVKRGDGTLRFSGDVCEVEVEAGMLAGSAQLKGLTTALGSIVESGDMSATLAVDGDASLGGTLRSHIGLETQSLEVSGDVVILTGSTLELQATSPLLAGNSTTTVLTGQSVDGTFTVEPNIGEHIGFGVFVAPMVQTGSAVRYNTTSVDIALRQANPGDADGDGTFDREDIIQILARNKYLTGQPASWTEGEWNGDGIFNQLDLFAALRSGFVS